MAKFNSFLELAPYTPRCIAVKAVSATPPKADMETAGALSPLFCLKAPHHGSFKLVKPVALVWSFIFAQRSAGVETVVP